MSRKLAIKKRRFNTEDLRGIAQQCVQQIERGNNPIDLLKKKGSSDPLNDWYDIRRWMKSNASFLYARIPMKWRVEITKQPEEQKEEEEMMKLKAEELKEQELKNVEPMIQKVEPKLAEPVKRKVGRPPKNKEEVPEIKPPVTDAQPKVEEAKVQELNPEDAWIKINRDNFGRFVGQTPQNDNTRMYPAKKKRRLKIGTVMGTHFAYTDMGDGKIELGYLEADDAMTISIEALRSIGEEIPELLEVLGK